MPMVDVFTDHLIDGQEGSLVIEQIRQYYTTQRSFEKNVSNVRRSFLRRGVRHPSFLTDIQNLYRAINDDNTRQLVDRFLELGLDQQYDVIKRAHTRPVFPGKLNDSFLNLHLLPDNMNTFCLANYDMMTSRHNQVLTLMERNRVRITVDKGADVLSKSIHILKYGADTNVDEILALLLISGRRETELLNGHSLFELIPGYPYHIKFTGVLKKKPDPMIQYSPDSRVIPLLCDATIFLNAFQRMRANQTSDTTSLSNKQISSRYCSQLGRASRRSFPTISKTHDLRGIYATFVYALFQHTHSFPMVCMYALSQDSIQDTLHYMSFELRGLDDSHLGANGPLRASG